MATYLDRILDAHRARAHADRRVLDRLIDMTADLVETRAFADALREAAQTELAVIAEIKRRSPSKGDLHADLDAEKLAVSYHEGGATCLSVLTDEAFFGGSAADLRAARGVVPVPVLRKDFTVDPRDVCDARLMGADCVLLIAAALDDAELRDMHGLAVEIGLDALVEIHDEAELERAVDIGAALVGVNQRDLVTFEVDHERARRVGAAMPADVVRVAESGVRSGADAASLADAGFHAVLVGETLVTSGDVGASLSELRVARST